MFWPISNLRAVMAALLLLLFAAPLVAIRTPEVLSTRDMGMGGASVALPNDVFLLWGNPAGLAMKRRFLTTEPRSTMVYVLPLRFGISDRFIEKTSEVADLLGDNNFFTGETEDLFGFFEELLALSDRVPIGLSAGLPINLSVIGYKWGFSMAGHLRSYFLPMGSIPTVKIRHSMGLDVRFGFVPYEGSWFSKDDLALGFGFKVLAYNIFDPVLKLDSLFAEAVSDGTAPGILSGLERSQTTRLGVGLDAGLTFHFAGGFTFGASAMDLFTPSLVLERIELNDFNLFEEVGFKLAVPDLRMGLAYRFGDSNPFLLKNLSWSFELHRLFDPLYVTSTRIHTGLSVDAMSTGRFVWNVAVGLNKGYLTYSTTVRLRRLLLLPPLQLSYALYRDEWGFAANTFGQALHILEVALRL